MAFKRSAGIILHPTSLPGPDGVGDLGPDAYSWVDFLKKSGCTIWQVLPLGPTGYGDSPYQCFSAFAGNPFLISPTLLLDEGLLQLKDFSSRPVFDPNAVDFAAMMEWKNRLFNLSFSRFQKSRRKKLLQDFQIFQDSNRYWLEDYSLFMAIKRSQGGIAWGDWSEQLRLRNHDTLAAFTRENHQAILFEMFLQFLFSRQWADLKDFANKQGIQILGDIPIFVAYDSADAWSHPEHFFLNRKGKPTVVAGVPPDYFSPTGQLWGNPLYRWRLHRQDGFQWWIARIRRNLEQFDILRLDHFRGFAGYWEIPAGKPTAEIGRWVKGPGSSFFQAVQASLGSLPIIAEDLGEITPDVVALRNKFNFPGMKILQFAFASDMEDPFLPHNYIQHCVAYTGTHDNDTSRGWYASAPDAEQDICRRYLARPGDDISWDLIRAVWSSVSGITLAPLQDFLSLGTEARMNYPGKLGGNWSWRFTPGAVDDSLCQRIREVNFLYDRDPNAVKQKKD